MLRDKKGQIRMTETIAVLFIFFVLILFGIIFYYNYQKSVAKERQQELLGQRAIETTVKTIFLPELICSKGDAEPEDNCFDLSKLRPARDVLSNHLTDYYFGLFGYSTITINQLYPYPQVNYTLYDKPKPDAQFQEPTYFVVTLKDDTKDSYGFGYVEVRIYQ